MALSFLDNVDYRGKKPNFTRDLFDTVADMVAFNENYLPDVFIACNKEDGKIYVFNRDNVVDTTFGKWRELEGGSGGASDWDSLIGKPFTDIDGNVFTVDENGVLSVEMSEVSIETISVNGITVESVDKNVNIEIPEFTEITKEDIMDMLGLSEEELEGLATLISDSEVRIDKTYSSSKIYTDIQKCLDDSKVYTLEQIAIASTASYKVVDSTANVTDAKYIYLIANSSNSYDMYILDDVNGATRIGETTIDLSGYLTTETANQTYVLQTVFDVLSGNIGNVAELVTTNKTVVSAINELKEAIDNATVEVSQESDNQIQTLEDGLFVGSETVTISKADYDALSDEEKNNGKTYFVPDDETTEDGTDLTQFAKVSDLEETNSKIEEMNDSLAKSTIAFTPNSEYVVTNYTYCHKSGHIVMLNVDLTYNVDAQYTEYVVGTIDSNFPESTIFNVILNGDGGKIQLYVRPSGEVMIETGNSTVGTNSRVRYQLMWIV